MSVKNQHEFHPDAEVLSAFAEQALDERERGEVLEHLAGCGRCRQVVALASEAAGAEVSARRHAPVRPRVWFRSWGLALAPVAAIAATAVIAISVHERNVERSVEMAKVEQQRSTEKAPMPRQASPQPPAQAGPPAASPAETPAPTGRPGAGRRAPVAEPDEPAAAPPPEGGNGLVSAREEPAGTSGVEGRGTMGAAFAPSGTPANDKTESEVALYDEERKKEAEREMEATDKRLFAAKRKTPGGEPRSGSGTAGPAPGGS
jgi:hypothetical protein